MNLPLVGRGPELEAIRWLTRRAEAGSGGTLILSGSSGVGKTRLLQAALAEARAQGWFTAVGRAYPVETGIPYAPFADAIVPLVRGLSPDALAALTRGSETELAHLFPMLGPPARHDSTGLEGAELKTRLLWNFSQFLGRVAARHPLLLVLDDLQWADASSLELLHFISRQVSGDRIALLCAYNSDLAGENPRLAAMEQSLTSIGVGRGQVISPLTHADTSALVSQIFGAPESTVREFTALLFGWTRGNPFFIEETLKTLTDSGRLRTEDGLWIGWDLENLALPRSVRDAVLGRLRALSSQSRSLGDLLSVVGTNVDHEVLLRLSEWPEADLVAAVGELRGHHVLAERLEGGSVVYDFAHPLVREVLYTELGLARARLLHARIAEALERYFGDAAIGHSGELAYHYARANSRDLAPKAIRYLAAAGRDALLKFSNREAADYLAAALDQARGAGLEVSPEVLEDLARSRQRLGDFEGAAELWRQRLGLARKAGDSRAAAHSLARLGYISYLKAQYPEALAHLEEGLEAARAAGDDGLAARLHLSRGECWLAVGSGAEGRAELEAALSIAEKVALAPLLARVHLALQLFHTWIGPPTPARQHGRKALTIATEVGDPGLLCTVHWGLAVLAGLTGDAPSVRSHMSECERIAEELGSPLHRLRAAEPAIEFLANTGDWVGAVELAERAISAARALNQRSQLSRILVWSALVHFGRGDLPRGKRYVEEAWELSCAARSDRPTDVHTAVPAHVGVAAYHLAAGDFGEAARVAEAGLRIADRTGYTAWAIHRLLPTLAEAHLFLGDLEGAARVGARLRTDSERLGHQLGLAWADACDALLVWMRGDIEGGISRLRAAAERLEAIPAIPDAARLRRHFAARLRDHGDREAALRELRHIHEIFVRLGAERELAKTREQIRELGARPPVKDSGQGVDGLSGREIEIALLVAQGKSNKTIGKTLDISPRTVSTHLSNIFGKIGVGSRGELAEFVRKADLGAR